MRGLRLITVRGIPIILHWTFIAFVVLIGAMALLAEDASGTAAAIMSLLLFLVALTCVTLHELAHSFVARRYGIRVHAIWLTPIGGLASMDRMPEDPAQEIWMSFAGPALNLAAAAVLFLFIWWVPDITFIVDPWNPFTIDDVLANETMFTQGTVLLFKINMALGVFNLLPAFPMDGGRILRAWLTARGRSRAAATVAAWRVSMVLLVLLGLAGFAVGTPWPAIMAAVLWLAGQGEVRQVRRSAPMKGLRAAHLLPQEPVALDPGITLGELVPRLLEDKPQHYPVVAGGRVVGVLSDSDLVAGVAREGGPELTVASVMRRPVTVSADDALEDVARTLAENDSPVALILERSRLVGLVSREMLETLGRRLEKADGK